MIALTEKVKCIVLEKIRFFFCSRYLNTYPSNTPAAINAWSEYLCK